MPFHSICSGGNRACQKVVRSKATVPSFQRWLHLLKSQAPTSPISPALTEVHSYLSWVLRRPTCRSCHMLMPLWRNRLNPPNHRYVELVVQNKVDNHLNLPKPHILSPMQAPSSQSGSSPQNHMYFF